MKTLEDLVAAKSVDVKISAANTANIIEVGAVVEDCINKYGLPVYAVIAGGAVRDTVYGLIPHDYDVFVDTTSLPEDEADDCLLLVADALCQTHPDKSLSPYTAGVDYQTPKKKFQVYETAIRVGEIHQEDPGFITQFAQVVGRRDEGLALDPLSFVEKEFYWDGVRLGYDIHKKEYFVSKKFIEMTKLKSGDTFDLVVDDEIASKTLDRAVDWLYRFKPANKPFVGFRLKKKETILEKISSTVSIAKLRF